MATRKTRKTLRANDVSAFIPEIWAMSVLESMHNSAVMLPHVDRRFEDRVASYGELVNVPERGTLNAYRRDKDDAITIQNLTSTLHQVKLDQYFHVAYTIADEDRAMSWDDVRAAYVEPGAHAIMKQIEACFAGMTYQFQRNQAGGVGLSASTADAAMLQAREYFRRNEVPETSRNLFIGPSSETTFLDTARFVDADKITDSTAIRTGLLGRLRGFNVYASPWLPEVAEGNSIKTGAVNLTAGYAKGATTLVVDGFTGAVTTGSWCSIAGRPYRITAHSEGSGNTTGITIAGGLTTAVVDDAVIKAYTPGAVNLSAGYSAGYKKEITINGFSVAPQVGQGVTFGTATDIYSVIAVNATDATTGITLNRPLAADIANSAIVSLMPAMNWNPAFHPDAITFVNRPLPRSSSSTGGSAVMNYNGLAIRVTFDRDPHYVRDIVTIDTLCGFTTLKSNFGAAIIS